MIFATSLAISCSQTDQLPTIVKAEVRFLADQSTLSADLALFKGDSFVVSTPFHPSPTKVTFLGSLMEARKMRGSNHFGSSRKIPLPEELRFAFPTDSLQDSKNIATLSFQLPVASIDALSPLISKGAKRTTFLVGGEPLKEKESLIMFFEPEERSERPRRVIIAGPSRSEEISVPTAALSEIPMGKYDIYLIRQGIIEQESDDLISTITYQYHTKSREIIVAE